MRSKSTVVEAEDRPPSTQHEINYELTQRQRAPWVQQDEAQIAQTLRLQGKAASTANRAPDATSQVDLAESVEKPIQ